MKIAFATMEKIENRPPNTVGSSRIRGRWLWENWDGAEEYKVGHEYDVMIFQKAYWREMMVNFPGIKIFDLCDPDWLEPRPVVESAQACDAVVTSTEALAEYLRKFVTDRPVICIPDRVELSEHTPRGPHTGDAKTIVWYGYSHNAHYLDKTYDFLIDAGLELTVISNTPLSPPRSFERLKVRNVAYNYASIHDELKKHDLVLLPSTGDDLKGQFKSNNKVLTAWALGMPVVQEPGDIERFKTAEARNEEMDLRLQEVKDKWDVKLSVQEYKDLIDQISKSKSSK